MTLLSVITRLYRIEFLWCRQCCVDGTRAGAPHQEGAEDQPRDGGELPTGTPSSSAFWRSGPSTTTGSSLEEKQRQPVTDRTEMPFWSNAQIGQWLHGIGLGIYTCNLEFSGLHGAVLYFDSSYDYHEIAITLQIPQNDSVARKRLKGSLSDLLSLPRSSGQEKKSRRRSFALFRRRSDAASLESPCSPRMSPEPPQSPDLPPSPYSEDDRPNPVQYYC